MHGASLHANIICFFLMGKKSEDLLINWKNFLDLVMAIDACAITKKQPYPAS